MDFWTEEKENELVSLWEQRPALYNCESKSYRDRNARTKALQEIADQLGASAEEVQRRLLTLRTLYTRHTKRPPSAGRMTKRQDWVLKTLQFLAPHVKRYCHIEVFVDESAQQSETDESYGNGQLLDNSLSDDGWEDGNERENNLVKLETHLEPLSSSEIHTSTKRSSSSGTTMPLSRVKRLKRVFIDNEEHDGVMKRLTQGSTDQDRDSEDDLEIFARNIVRKLRHVKNTRTLLIVQSQIEQLCFQAQMGVVTEIRWQGGLHNASGLHSVEDSTTAQTLNMSPDRIILGDGRSKTTEADDHTTE